MKKKLIALISCVPLLSSILYAQTLSVTSENSNKETKIVFNAVSNKSADIYRINNMSSSAGTTSSVSTTSVYSGGSRVGTGVSSSVGGVSSSGMNYTFVCSTPNELTLDMGELQCRVGTSVSNTALFNIRATGGTQYWDIKRGNDVLFTGGIVLTALGFSFAIPTFIVAAVLDFGEATPILIGAGVASAIMGVAGIPMIPAGKAKATLVRIEL